jgi:hypothetical protein
VPDRGVFDAGVVCHTKWKFLPNEMEIFSLHFERRYGLNPEEFSLAGG